MSVEEVFARTWFEAIMLPNMKLKAMAIDAIFLGIGPPLLSVNSIF
jgi:hypothetical protein